MPASIKIPTVFTAEDKFTRTVSQMSKSIKGFSRDAVAGIKRVDHRVNSMIRGVGKLGLLLGGLTLGTLASSAFNDVTQFETGLVGVGKTTGIEGSKLKDLGVDILKTSKALRTIESEKLLELAQSAGQLGVKGTEDILKFSTVLAKLEGASDVVGEEGASSIARLLTLTKEGPAVVDKFASSLVALGNSSAATESEILGVASEVARSTNAYGLKSKEILGLAATLKSLDVRPEAAGTAVGKVFRSIEMATIKGGKDLSNFGKVMGLTSSQVTETFKNNPNEAFNLFIKGLDRIGKEGGSIAKVLNNVGLSGETVSKGIIPLATNYELLSDKIGMASSGFENNIALQEEFEASQKTVKNGINSIKIAFSNLAIEQATAGSGLETLQDVLFYVAENMDIVIASVLSLIALFITWKAIVLAATIATTANSIAMGVMAARTGAMAIAMKGNVVAIGAYRVAMALSTGITWLATAATTAFGIAMNLGLWPILAIIAAIALVVYAIKNWSKISEWFGEKWKQFTDLISEAWDNVVKWFTAFDFKQFFVEIGASIIQFMLLPLKGVLQLISKIPGKIGDFAQMGLDKINEFEGNMTVGGDKNKEVLPSSNQTSSETLSKKITENNLNIKIKDKGNNVEDISKTGAKGTPINLTPTLGMS